MYHWHFIPSALLAATVYLWSSDRGADARKGDT